MHASPDGRVSLAILPGWATSNRQPNDHQPTDRSDPMTRMSMPMLSGKGRDLSVAERHNLPVSVVAGNFIRVPNHPLIERIAAGSGMDAADDWIAERAQKGDIVVTSDIPLAARCVKAGADVIAPNGKPFSEASIGMTLAVRNLMTDLRSSGEVTGGPRSFSPRDRSAFLSALDQTIRRIQRAQQK